MASALVVIDVQNGFVREGSRGVIPHVIELVRYAKDRGLLVAFTRFFNRDGSPFVRWVQWDRMAGPPETDLHSEVRPLADLVFDKTSYTSFTPEFRSWLQNNGITRLYCSGIATESCVLKTAVDAFEAEIEPVVVTDACASHAGPEVHEMGLKILARFIGRGQLCTTSDFQGMI